MSIFFKSILSLSLSGTLLIILMFLCKPLLRDRISKRWQYYMWVVVIIRLLVPFTLPASPVNTLFQEVDRAMVQMTVNLAENSSNILPERESDDANYEGFGTNERVPVMAHTSVSEKLVVILQNLWLVWLIGALLLLIRKITIYQGFVKYVRAGCSEVSDIDLLNQMAQYEEQIGVKTPVELYVNSLVASPLLIGFFKPCIVLSTTDLSDSDLGYIIMHELSHYKHRDMFYKWIVQITLCLHWFNPFVHLMCHEINRACELACDEAIISKLEIKERETYGDMLLHTIGSGGVYHNSIASMTLYENKAMIKERLRAIKNFKKKTIWVTLGSFVLVIGLVAVSTVIGAYAATSITGNELVLDTASPIAEDKQGETEVPTKIDSKVSHSDDISIIRDGGVSEPTFTDQYGTVYVVAFLKDMTENSITVDVIEYVTSDNAERVNELGLTERDMPDGYYLYNPEQETVIWELNEQTVYSFIDWYGDFTGSDYLKEYTTTDVEEFHRYIETYDDAAPGMPFFFLVEDGVVKMVLEKFFA